MIIDLYNKKPTKEVTTMITYTKKMVNGNHLVIYKSYVKEYIQFNLF